MKRFRSKKSTTSQNAKDDSKQQPEAPSGRRSSQPPFTAAEVRLSSRVTYLGCLQVPDARSVQLLYDVIKQVKQLSGKRRGSKGGVQSKQVIFQVHAARLVVSDLAADPILNIPLGCVSLCANAKGRSSADLFAVSATAQTTKTHECFVFQAQSARECSDIVRTVSLSFKLLQTTRRASDPGGSATPRIMHSVQFIPEAGGDPTESSTTPTLTHPRIAGRRSSVTSAASNQLSVDLSDTHSLGQFSGVLETDTSRSSSVNIDVESLLSCELEELAPRVDRVLADRERMKLVCTTGDATLLPEESRHFVSALFAIGRYDADELEKILSSLSANAYDGMGRTLLHYATACGYDDAAKVLLERNANLDAEDVDGLTPLHLAATVGDLIMVQLLLTSGAPVNALDNAYRSPLLLCVAAQTENFVDCCYALIERGAHVDTKDINGITPVSVFKDLAEMQNRLVELACNALSSVADIDLRDLSPTGDAADLFRSPIQEGTFMEHYNSLQRSSNRLSMASSATWLSSSSIASTLKRKSEVDLLADPLTSASVRRLVTSVSLPRNLEGLDSDAKNALLEFDDMLSKSEVNLLGDGESNEGTLCTPSQTDLLELDESDRENNSITDNPAAVSEEDVPSNASATNNSSPSSEATLTPNTSVWNTLDSTYRRSATAGSAVTTDSSVPSPLLRSRLEDDFKRLSMSSLSTLASTTSTLKARHVAGAATPDASTYSTLDSTYRAYGRRRSPGPVARIANPNSEGNSTQSSSFNTLESVYGGHRVRRFSETSLQRRLAKFVKGNNNGSSGAATSRRSVSSISGLESEESLLKLELGLSSLRLLVTLASNHECHSLIISHICLPNNSSELVRMARGAVAGDNVRDCIATLIHRLFETSGPISRQRAVDAGLLSIVLELLDAPEPVQSTCLSVAETVLHSETEGDKDFVAAVANMEPDILLRLLSETKLQRTLEKYQSVALRFLSIASGYRKFCLQLNTDLALNCVVTIAKTSISEQTLVYALKTLANIATNMDSHKRMASKDVKALLKQAVERRSSPGTSYHAKRALIYLGEQEVNGSYLFANVQDLQSEFLHDEEEEEFQVAHVRALSIEHLVYLMTTEIKGHWRGLGVSPRRSSRPETIHLAENSVEFILTSLRTFVEPPIFLRLLLHRFQDMKTLVRFESGKRRARLQHVPSEPPLMEEYVPLPVHHLHIMRILQHWLEHFKQDFREYPIMKKDVKKHIKPLKRMGGPYVPCSEKLKLLCQNLKKDRPRSGVSEVFGMRSDGDPPHEELYKECCNEVTSGSLPVTVEQAVNFAAIQCYIEELKSPPVETPRRRSSSNLSLFGDKTLNTKLKHCLPPEIRGKTVAKRIRTTQEHYSTQHLSDRNAKHLYISKAYELDHYGCRFFHAKDTAVKGTLKRSLYARRLVGVSSKRIVIMDEKTKEICESFSFSQLKTWVANNGNNTILLEFPGLSFAFLLDSSEELRGINGYIWECAEELDWMSVDSLDVTPWSKTAELQGKWGNVALIDAAKTPKVKQKASAMLSPLFSDELAGEDDNESSPSSSPSSSSPSSACPSPETTPRTTMEKPRVPQLAQTHLIDRPSMPPTFAGILEDDCEQHLPLAPKASHISAASSYEPTQSDSGMGTNSSVSQTFSEATSRTASSRLYSGSILSGSSTYDGLSTRETGGGGSTVVCHCPPDPLLGIDFDHQHVTLDSVLDHPKELARQITLIDHELLCKVTAEDCLQKVKASVVHQELSDSNRQVSVERFAHRFNQLCNWATASVLTARAPEQRAVIISQMIQVARYCYHYRNYNATMAILVAALGGTPVRRLKKTWEALDKESLETYQKLESIFVSKNNFKIYRERLRATETPAVPYFGLYLKDLTFAADGNPDYLKGGLINLDKRRQMYTTLRELRRFQNSIYSYVLVPSIQEYLLRHVIVADADLHETSRQLEAPIRRRKARP
eukprot:m.202022 g.202022  ORF g.202022 m.202022 type:complete len:1950 (+) comp39602_c1_seq2:196-6045(+)